MSHPIQNMPAGYKVEEVRIFGPKRIDAVVVCNYEPLREVVNYAITFDQDLVFFAKYATAIFRIKWKT